MVERITHGAKLLPQRINDELRRKASAVLWGPVEVNFEYLNLGEGYLKTCNEAEHQIFVAWLQDNEIEAKAPAGRLEAVQTWLKENAPAFGKK